MTLMIAFDLETTGVDPNRDQILQMAAVVFDSETGEVKGEFNDLVRHERYEGDPFALQMNAAILKRLAAGEGLRLHEVVSRFTRFCSVYKPEKLYPIGFNVASFDIAFLKAAIGNRVIRPNLHHRCVDMGTYLAPLTGSPTPIGSNDATAELLGREVTHDALQDCHDAREMYLKAKSLYDV